MQINIPYFSIRLLTVLSYFLPFVFFLSTCESDLESRESFNTKDAITNETNSNNRKKSDLNSFLSSLDNDSVFENASNKNIALASLKEKIEQTFNSSDNIVNLKENNIQTNILCPTNYSLSGIGSLFFHKNLLGKVALSISLLLSIITLFFWVIIKTKRSEIYIILLNVLFVVLFIFDCLLTQVELKYGAFVLLFLLLIQIVTEIQTQKLSQKTDSV